MFRGVSPMRIFSSFGHSPGNTCFQFRFNLRQISTPRFSDVGTTVRESRHLPIQIPVVERRQHFAAAPIRPAPAVSTARPVAASSGPAHAHFHHVIVPVAVGIVALAVQLAGSLPRSTQRECRRCEAANSYRRVTRNTAGSPK